MLEKRKAVIVRDLANDTITLYSNLKKAYEANKIWISYSAYIKEIAALGYYEFGEIEIRKVEIN